MTSKARSDVLGRSGLLRPGFGERGGGILPKILLAAVVAGLLGCNEDNSRSKPPAKPAANGGQAVDPALRAEADRVAQGVGELVRTTPKHALGPVYVVEEYHNSQIGQVQVATMLTRLYRQQGVRIVGLEGAVKGPAPLPTDKFVNVADRAARRSVLKNLLCDGEISGVEYAGAVIPALQVVGIEDPNEYRVRPPEGGAPEFMAILAIAEQTLKPDVLRDIATKLSKEKVSDAIDAMKEADPWIRARLDSMKNDNPKLEDQIANVRAIQDKARSLNIDLPPEVTKELEASVTFYRAAEQRSSTMATAVAALARQAGGKPVAMVIGAAHTDRVLAELEKQDATVIVLRPKDFKGERDVVGTRRFLQRSRGLAPSAGEGLGEHGRRHLAAEGEQLTHEAMPLDAGRLEGEVHIGRHRRVQGTQSLLLVLGAVAAMLGQISRRRLPLGAEMGVFDTIGRQGVLGQEGPPAIDLQTVRVLQHLDVFLLGPRHPVVIPQE